MMASISSFSIFSLESIYQISFLNKQHLLFFCLSFYHNYFMSSRHSLSLTSHFSSRFSQYLFFLQVTNDQQLVYYIFSFLTIPEILEFAATSSHFRQLLDIQNIELRLLRAKLKFYEQPKQLSTDSMLIPFAFVLPSKPTMRKLDKPHQDLKKFNRGIRFYNFLRKEGVVVNRQSFNEMLEKKGYKEFDNLYDQIHGQEGDKFEPLVNKGQWTLAKESELNSFKKYLEYLQKENKMQIIQNDKIAPVAKIVAKKKEQNPFISKMEEIENRRARQEYEKRKKTRMQERKNESTIASLEQIKKLADRDPKSREIFNKVYEEEKAKWQRENVAKLTMKPLPQVNETFVKKITQSQVEKPIPKQSIAGKVYSGLKQLLWTGYQ